MRKTMRPRCAGSELYGPHHVSVEYGYTLIQPGGTVVYACDTDCLRRLLDTREEEARQATGAGWPGLRQLARRAR
jgi:hypothetical protein